jgi:hypothetical protein
MKTFVKYHEANPQIYNEFQKIAFEFINRGYKRIGAKMVCEIIRYQSMIKGDGTYKVNNNFTADYARKFEKDFPQYVGIFTKRLCNFDD